MGNLLAIRSNFATVWLLVTMCLALSTSQVQKREAEVPILLEKGLQALGGETSLAKINAVIYNAPR
jgi:hypothetical protein